MKLPRNTDADDLVKALSRLGYRVVRQSGSHLRLQCSDPLHSLTIPNHSPLRIGTLASILSDIATRRRIDKESLIKLLFE
jgi:predicted RNA binding protein YcfA (HicA-like mRNA interferase family)